MTNNIEVEQNHHRCIIHLKCITSKIGDFALIEKQQVMIILGWVKLGFSTF